MNAINCTFISNSVTGGDGALRGWPSAVGGAGADGNGGAIANVGTMLLTGCLFANNAATGGAGGDGSAGFYACPGDPGGAGADGGQGNGGALFNNGPAYLVNNTLALNVATGGQGGSGGSGGPPFSQSCRTGNGGHGGMGGSACSAVGDVNGQCYFTNCTVALNTATPGLGGAGGPAGPWPYPYPPILGSPGANGANGEPGSALQARGTHLLNTLLSSNAPMNAIGALADDGHNLSSDGSCYFTNAGSMTNGNPKLGPLADNGGPTPTLALLPGSPAVEAGDRAGAPVVDQRGIARPQGFTVDIGAFEYEFDVPQIISASCQSGSNFWMRFCGLPNERYAIQITTNLLTWSDVTNVLADPNGAFEWLDRNLRIDPARFYRIKELPQ